MTYAAKAIFMFISDIFYSSPISSELPINPLNHTKTDGARRLEECELNVTKRQVYYI